MHLITRPRKNMKNQLMHLSDKLLQYKRAIIESIIDQLKNISQIEHSRHRSLVNFAAHLVARLLAYSHQDKKPGCISIHRFSWPLDRLGLNSTHVWLLFLQTVLVVASIVFTEEATELVHGILLQRGNHMAVNVQGDHDITMPWQFLHHFRMHSSGQQRGGAASRCLTGTPVTWREALRDGGRRGRDVKPCKASLAVYQNCMSIVEG